MLLGFLDISLRIFVAVFLASWLLPNNSVANVVSSIFFDCENDLAQFVGAVAFVFILCSISFNGAMAANKREAERKELRGKGM